MQMRFVLKVETDDTVKYYSAPIGINLDPEVNQNHEKAVQLALKILSNSKELIFKDFPFLKKYEPRIQTT